MDAYEVGATGNMSHTHHKRYKYHIAVPASDPGPAIASGARTAPSDLRPEARPERCPLCQHSAIARWQKWIEHDGEWIWHCHYLSRRSNGAPFCGHMWCPSRPVARCGMCGLTLQIEQHSGVLGYWCGFCQDFSQ
jgi:hypothetical protein